MLSNSPDMELQTNKNRAKKEKSPFFIITEGYSEQIKSIADAQYSYDELRKVIVERGQSAELTLKDSNGIILNRLTLNCEFSAGFYKNTLAGYKSKRTD